MWIDTRKRQPTEDDADAQGCVLVWDVNNGARTAGYRQVRPGSTLSHWRRLPPGPAIMRHSVDADMPRPVVEFRLSQICASCRNSRTMGERAVECENCIVYSAHRAICSHYAEKARDQAHIEQDGD